MNREFQITPVKTYKTPENARAAVAKTGDEDLPHFIMQEAGGRFFPVFRVSEGDLARTGIHFRWNCI
jgi:hypothetical protein